MSQLNPIVESRYFDRCIFDASEIPRREADRCYSVASRIANFQMTLRSPMYSLKTVLAGTERYEFANGARKLSTGDFLLVAPGTKYTGQVRGRWETVGRCYYFTEEAAAPIAAVLDLFGPDRAPPVFDFADLGVGDGALLGDANKLVPVLRVWVRRWLDDQARVDRVDPLTRARILRGLERARRAMEEEFDTRWTVASLAQISRQSPAAFARNFARVYECTPARYLERRRLAHAAERLESAPVLLTKLAMDCGYPDLPTFSKAFRRHYGVPPSQWRYGSRNSTSHA